MVLLFKYVISKPIRCAQGLNNLIVLSREEAGASMILKEGGLAKLKLVFCEKDPEIVQGAVRILGTLAKGSKLRVSRQLPV